MHSYNNVSRRLKSALTKFAPDVNHLREWSKANRLKGYEEKVAGLMGLELQVSTLKKQGLVWKFLASDEYSRVQGELLSLAASTGFERGLSMHRTKDEFADVLKKMVNFIPGVDRDTRSKIVRVVVNVAYVPFVVASEQNEEQVNAMVDGSNLEMADATAVDSERISSVPTDVVVALFVGGKGDGSVPSSTIEDVVVPPSRV
uniref:Uncharacterized protein n=1 Tax=Tanacetum cinerariifolium TaxID=118510 RepID=A0A6L2MZ66_TANCI|nr:hypothetical protein [Tanacetum cinerariifolium]